MKWSHNLRLPAVLLMAGFALASAPSVRATILHDSDSSVWERAKEKEKEKEKEREHERDRYKKGDKDRKTTQVPEGSAGVILMMAAGVLGGGVLVWRHKQRAANVPRT